MVDNRSAGFFGVGGAFNFRSGDISGTAAKTSDDKMGQGSEYAYLEGSEEEQEQAKSPFVDRSAQLRATLNSLALMNVANVLNDRKRIEILKTSINLKGNKEDDEQEKVELDEEFLNDFDEEGSQNDEDNEYY